ncbi:MAG: patatin-like phospholipase family protein [Planctomycetes bacterium]|nr:patatin-like phospholipase family protein [Planctomycetota bacterium]
MHSRTGSVITQADAVFAGGGVKGIGLIGALNVASEMGIAWKRVGGSSAGAIVAALVAAGYENEELKNIFLDEFPYRKMREKNILNYLSYPGALMNLFFYLGLWNSTPLYRFLQKKLADRGIVTFADLRRQTDVELRVVCSDITRGRTVVFPRDLVDYDIDPDTFEVALAVRISSALPLVFRPIHIAGSNFVDGGILSNFPVWLFDVPDGVKPRWPTIGFRLMDPNRAAWKEKKGIIAYLMSIFTTMHDAHNPQVADSDRMRTISIPTLGIRTADFGISREQRLALYEAGRDAAKLFFQLWHYDVREHRRNS